MGFKIVRRASNILHGETPPARYRETSATSALP
jgi:hypothetical protein